MRATIDVNYSLNSVMIMIKRIFRHKIGQPVLALIKQGISPKKMSLSVAFGVTIGMLPILGSTTLICAAFAVTLRLNLPAIQLFNYLVYPLQIFLLIPFINLGAFLFQVELPLWTVEELSAMFQYDFWGAIASFFETMLYAVAAWFIVCTPLFIVLYALLVPVLKRLAPITMNQSMLRSLPDGNNRRP